jgi:carbonic anhydrase/acetyltransferase-like protein (isoleucine patch superfamily)
MIRAFGGVAPRIHPEAYVVDAATVIGDVEIGAASSIWFNAVVRGDIHAIRVGARSNVQDNATIHVVGGRFSTTIGDGVTIGHNAVVHGCVLEDGVLVGMGAIVLDGAVVGAGSLIGAGAVVPPGTRVPPGSLVLGNPGRIVRALSEEERGRHADAAARYVDLLARYRAERA